MVPPHGLYSILLYIFMCLSTYKSCIMIVLRNYNLVVRLILHLKQVFQIFIHCGTTFLKKKSQLPSCSTMKSCRLWYYFRKFYWFLKDARLEAFSAHRPQRYRFVLSSSPCKEFGRLFVLQHPPVRGYEIVAYPSRMEVRAIEWPFHPKTCPSNNLDLYREPLEFFRYIGLLLGKSSRGVIWSLYVDSASEDTTFTSSKKSTWAIRTISP